jgi:hypothetical protein
MPEAQQQQFDWHKESGKCIEGLRLPIGEDLTFELDYDNVELKAATRKDGSVVLRKDGTVSKIWKIPFIEVQSKVSRRLDFWHSDTPRVNPNNPEVEDDFVKFSRRLGYSPVVGGDFIPEDFLKRGLRIIAQLAEEVSPTDPTKKFSNIVLTSVRLESAGASASAQETLPSDDPELQAEVLGMAEDCAKFSDLVKKINKAKRTQDLLPVASKMKKDGLIDLK